MITKTVNPLCAYAIVALAFCSFPGYLSAQYSGAAPAPSGLAPGFDSITPEQSEQFLSVLAGPVFSGRGSGQEGYTKAAHWVAGKAAEFGLEPMGDGGTYFQMLPMARISPDMTASRITGPDGLEISGAKDLGFDRYGEEPLASGSIVFLKLPGDSPALDETLSLRDKIVVYVAAAANFRTTRAITSKQPAAIIQVVTRPTTSSQIKRGGGRRRATSLSASISEAAASKLLHAVGGEQDWLELDEGSAVEVHAVDQELSIEIRLREEQLATPNVVAWLPGSDPELAHEHVVVGAHLDHLGTRGESWYPGADDNGSGSTALLNVAKALSTNPVKPKRSVLFIWFAAEEIGLVGSRHYCDNPRKPLEDVVCMFNMDMVGRCEETDEESAEDNIDTIHLIGSKQGNSGLHEVIVDANAHVNFQFEYDQESVFGRSDQANFYRKGIPVAFLFGGFHPNYHQTTDTIDRIDMHKIASAAKLFYLSIHAAAEHGRFELQEGQ